MEQKEPETNLASKAETLLKEVHRDREEILKAFVAKYGVGPEAVEQVEQRTENGIVWSVRMKKEHYKLDIITTDAAPPGTIACISDGKITGMIKNVTAEPEKAKEEKVENKSAIRIYAIHPFDGDRGSLPLSEAARIAQLPQVIAEVERQRKEKEIKVGDWVWSRAKCCYSRVEKILNFPVVGIAGFMPEDNGEFYELASCTKIDDPAFIAMLEKGSQP